MHPSHDVSQATLKPTEENTEEYVGQVQHSLASVEHDLSRANGENNATDTIIISIVTSDVKHRNMNIKMRAEPMHYLDFGSS